MPSIIQKSLKVSPFGEKATGGFIDNSDSLTVIVISASALQPPESVPITTYVVVIDGLAVGVALSGLLSDSPGVHANVLAPDASNCISSPAAIVVFEASISMTGTVSEATVILLVNTHPPGSVAVTE